MLYLKSINKGDYVTVTDAFGSFYIGKIGKVIYTPGDTMINSIGHHWVTIFYWVDFIDNKVTVSEDLACFDINELQKITRDQVMVEML